MCYFGYYLFVINIIGLILCFIDKVRAIKNKWRISEFSLFFITIIGGCYGLLLGMYIFHHKTKKSKFRILVPIIGIIWILIIYRVMCL